MHHERIAPPEGTIASNEIDTPKSLPETRLRTPYASEDSERALPDGEERFGNLVEVTGDCVWEVDEHFVLRYISPRVWEILGFDPEELCGRTLQERMPPDEAHRVDAILGPITAVYAPFAFLEHISRHKDGHPVILETSGVPIFDEEGGFRGYRGIDRDITERKRAEESLRKLQREHELILNAVGEGICRVDLDGRIAFANPAAAGLTGWSLDELAGVNLHSVVHHTRPDGTPYPREQCPLYLTLTDQHDRRVDEEVFWRKDGTSFPVEYIVTAVHDEQGRTVGGVTVFHDITERRRAVAALQESERRFHEMLQNVKLIAVMLDREGNIIFCNDFLLELTGWRRSEVQGQSWFDLFLGPEDRQTIASFYLASIGTGHLPVHRENDIVTRNGGRRRIAWNNTPLRDPDGKVMGAASIGEDITEHRKAEEHLLLWSKVLENSVEGIMVTDADNAIVTVNQAFTRVTGYALEEVRGKNPRLLQAKRQDRGFYQNMWAAITETGHWQGELWNRRKNGEVYPQWTSISTLRDSQGAITHHIGVFSDITERKAADERIRYLAHYDVLTGLANRTLLQARLEQALAAARRDRTYVALLFLDLDRFKNINDSLGHYSGDTVLQAVGERLRACVREGDTVARLGGDEFVIMLPDLRAGDDAARVAEKVFGAMAHPFFIAGHELNLTLSLGISVYPDDGNEIGSLIKNADAAMYHAKEAGRNNYQFYTGDMNARALEALALENRLRHALERRELLLYFQPQVDLWSGRIIGAEALLRWQQPELGLVPPGKFIPIAEERGLIVPIGDWVLRNACAQNLRWQQQGLPAMPVAVNISALQFHQKGFVDKVAQAVQQSGLDPRYLELEITESILMRDAEATVAMMRALRAMGLKLSIDDFGTGYSSLSYLRRFPLDRLKIDQSFVRDMAANSDAAAIASVIITLAKTLKLKAIAEGVETQAQLDLLRAQGCDEMQGYYFSKPLPAAEFEGLLKHGQGMNYPAASCGVSGALTKVLGRVHKISTSY
jgi:diguanylate cyclase (GGDEF)-like protein/PAS domain S-box-containing protein